MLLAKLVLAFCLISAGTLAQTDETTDAEEFPVENPRPDLTHEENEPHDDHTVEEVEENATNVDDNDDNVEIDDGKPSQFEPRMGRLINEYGEETPLNDLEDRYAPTIESQKPGQIWVMPDGRLEEMRKELMYWFYDLGGDSENHGDYQRVIQTSSPTVHKNLNFQLPFFGFRYNYTRVSLNGYLEFSDPPENYGTYPLVFPNKDWPKSNDPAFIGIWHSKCRIGALRDHDRDQRKPGVYFRLDRDLLARTDRHGVEMRERLKWDIRNGTIGAETFQPKHAITVTWKNVTFAGGISNALYLTNTFQMVIATDEVFTYAIFNYKDLQWTTHTEAGGDTTTGEGGTPAFVGFNGGNGTRSFEYKPYSQDSVIRDLIMRGHANGIPGRHIFRIDENVMLGSCNKDLDKAHLPLVIAPESGNMLGGTVVNITGPCFTPDDKIRCKFDVVEDEVEGTYIDQNRAICIQPRLYVEGYIQLEVSIGNGKFKWKGQYFVEPPGSATEKIFFDGNAIHEKYPSSIKMKWAKHNLTTNENKPVRMSLWGYRERTVTPEFVYIDDLALDITNNGQYDLSPADYRNRDNKYFNDIKFGFIQINLTDTIIIEGSSTNFQFTPVIWSRPIPLGWYFAPQWERMYGKMWPARLCDNWIKSDRFLKNFAHELHQCPCRLEHALNDKGRYLPDAHCDKDTDHQCQFNKGAVHCVRSGAPTLEGSEQQCCYDKNHYLMMSYDQQWGSSPFRSHQLGFLPWNEADKVPTLSQWFHDITPKYFCCLWQDNVVTGETGEQSVGCETLRFERRPTQDCVAYQPPEVAGVYGDPHIITFDDYEYTFNGLGEFSLVHVENHQIRLDVQGRFEQMPINLYGEVRASQLTSIAARGNGTTVIEVRARPKEATWRYRLDVLADGRRIYFDRPALKYQHFPGVLVYTPSYILNQSEVILMFDSGAGVEVVENQGFMTARVYLPWKFVNQTRGLFGNWSFNPEDDLALPDGTEFPLVKNNNLDFKLLYHGFGKHWMVESHDKPNVGRSLFTYDGSRSSNTYNNRTFEPEFAMQLSELVPVNRSEVKRRAEELCYTNYQCAYDYAMTLNRDLAHFSYNYHSSIKNIKEVNHRSTISCGVLPTPRFGRKSNFFFVPGTKVTFECNEFFIMIGDQRRECLKEGVWDLPVYGYTECLREQEYSSRTAGITTAIVLTIIISITVLLLYIGFKVWEKENKKSEAERAMQNTHASMSKAALAHHDSFFDEDNSTIPSSSAKEKSEADRSISPSKETEIL